MKQNELECFKSRFNVKKALFNSYLSNFCSNKPDQAPLQMWEAMTYSLKIGGKRLRPVLCISSADIFSTDESSVLPMALALEMVHTASLIHDDLPAMDDDTLRRGKPTNHVVYGEALAILAGDALLCEAFNHPLAMLSGKTDPNRLLKASGHFARALGPVGICGGQVLDMENIENAPVEKVQKTAELKTGALIKTSVATGAILGGCSSSELEAMENYGIHLGKAFQIADDILDVIGTKEEMGKTLGKDQEQGKNTFVSSYGLEGAKEQLRQETQLAIESITMFEEKGLFLSDLARYLEHRTH